ncbi:transmembrane protein 151B [Nematostella vectensis]|nr:transmembrane protein 151B [Nematostella vectensis]XP_032242936.2 transmembrane protein 151B [Nematostella vectensis]
MREAAKDEFRLQEFSCKIDALLQEVARAETPEEQAQKVHKYQRAVRRHQARTEARDKRRRRGLCRNANLWRLYSMGMWMSFILWCLFLISCHATQCGKYGSIMDHLWIMAIVVVCVAPLIVLLESFCSNERFYIINVMKDETALDYIRRMQEAPPVIEVVVECYHTRYDRRGNEIRKTTFTAKDSFDYGSWLDISTDEIPELSSVEFTRLKIDPEVEFGDAETARSFDTKIKRMMEKHRHRDMYQGFSYSSEIPGLAKRISAYVDLRQRPFWISERYYWVATFLFMTWPYRWLFRAKTAKTHYALKKRVYKCSPPPPQVDIMNPFALLALNPAIQCANPSLLDPTLNSDVSNASDSQALGVATPYLPDVGEVPPTPADAGDSSGQEPYPPPYPTPAGGHPLDQESLRLMEGLDWRDVHKHE